MEHDLAKRKKRLQTRTLSDAELLQRAEDSLKNIEMLCERFDAGLYNSAYSMPTDIWNLLTQNEGAIRLRGDKRFPVLHLKDHKPDKRNLAPDIFRLVYVQVGGIPCTQKYIPRFRMDRSEVVRKDLIFREWWNREVVYRAGAALPGTSPGLIPVNGTPQVPFEDRQKLTRFTLIQEMRNRISSHTDREYPVIFDDINNSFGIFVANNIEQAAPTMGDDGTVAIEVPALAAMVRQIAWEILVAYGRIP